MSVSIKNGVESFYDLLFLENISSDNKDEIVYLLRKIDIHYDMIDNSKDAKYSAAINRKIINQILQLGFVSCKYKRFDNHEIKIDKDYCIQFNDYASAKEIPEIYPINYENFEREKMDLKIKIKHIEDIIKRIENDMRTMRDSGAADSDPDGYKKLENNLEKMNNELQEAKAELA